MAEAGKKFLHVSYPLTLVSQHLCQVACMVVLQGWIQEFETGGAKSYIHSKSKGGGGGGGLGGCL